MHGTCTLVNRKEFKHLLIRPFKGLISLYKAVSFRPFHPKEIYKLKSRLPEQSKEKWNRRGDEQKKKTNPKRSVLLFIWLTQILYTNNFLRKRKWSRCKQKIFGRWIISRAFTRKEKDNKCFKWYYFNQNYASRKSFSNILTNNYDHFIIITSLHMLGFDRAPK